MLVVGQTWLQEMIVIADDALSAVSESHRRLALSACDRELVGVALIRVARDPVLDGFWDRTLHIVERPGGPRLRPVLTEGTGVPAAAAA